MKRVRVTGHSLALLVPVPVVVRVDAVIVVVILQLVEDRCAKEENGINPYFFLSIEIQVEGSTHLSNERAINKKLVLLFILTYKQA